MSYDLSAAVYCGSSPGHDPDFIAAAATLGESFAKNRIRLVYGAGDRGLMGAVANATMAAGGDVFGVIPQSMVDREWGKTDITHFIRVETMHERKKVMAANADAFVALPGGPGTLDELIEVLTWRQLKFHDQPIVIVNVKNYWAPLLALLDSTIENGFARPSLRRLFDVVERPEDVAPLLLEKTA